MESTVEKIVTFSDKAVSFAGDRLGDVNGRVNFTNGAINSIYIAAVEANNDPQEVFKPTIMEASLLFTITYSTRNGELCMTQANETVPGIILGSREAINTILEQVKVL